MGIIMENNRAVTLCQNWLASWSGNKPEALINFYHDDIYYCDPARPQGIKGKENLLNYFHKLLAKYPDWIWEMIELFPQPTGFLLKWRAKLSPQAETVFFGLDIVEIKDDKIIRNEVFFDPSLMRVSGI